MLITQSLNSVCGIYMINTTNQDEIVYGDIEDVKSIDSRNKYESKSNENNNQGIIDDILAIYKVVMEQRSKTHIFEGCEIMKLLEKFRENNRDLFSNLNQDDMKKLFELLKMICIQVLIYEAFLSDQYHNERDKNHESKLYRVLKKEKYTFLGPQLQEEVLHLILRVSKSFPRLSRRVLISYVVFMLKNDYPKITKNNVRNVLQILYKADCIKSKRVSEDGEIPSLIELKQEYANYESLRRQHDVQIIQIVMEYGIQMTAEKWSQMLYGDSNHKSEMQSVIDKLQSVRTIDKLSKSLYKKLESYSLRGLSSKFDEARDDFEFIASINLAPRESDSLTESNSPFQSDDDQKSEYSEDKYWNISSDHSNSQAELSKKPEIQRDRISWTILDSCLQRTLNILNAHAEFSNRLMSMIIANQKASNDEISQSFNSNRYRGANNSNWHQQPWSQNRQQTQQRYQPQFNQMNQNQRADFQPQFNRNQNGAFRFPDSRNQHQQSSYRPQSSFRNANNSNVNSSSFRFSGTRNEHQQSSNANCNNNNANSSFYHRRRNQNFQN